MRDGALGWGPDPRRDPKPSGSQHGRRCWGSAGRPGSLTSSPPLFSRHLVILPVIMERLEKFPFMQVSLCCSWVGATAAGRGLTPLFPCSASGFSTRRCRCCSAGGCKYLKNPLLPGVWHREMPEVSLGKDFPTLSPVFGSNGV